MSGYVATVIGTDHGLEGVAANVTIPANCNLFLLCLGIDNEFSTTEISLDGSALTEVTGSYAFNGTSAVKMLYVINKAQGTYELITNTNQSGGWVCVYIGLALPSAGWAVGAAAMEDGSPTNSLVVSGTTVGQLLISSICHASADLAVSTDLTAIIATETGSGGGELRVASGYVVDADPLIGWQYGGVIKTFNAVAIQGNSPTSVGIFYF